MTKEEIKKFLDNTKVYVNGRSAEIQKKLFSFGYTWADGKNNVKHTDKPFLFIYENNEIAFTYDMECFVNHENMEITAEEILSLKLTEDYRPFKDRDECWNEMLKHQPFGWIKSPREELFCIDKVFDTGIAYKHSKCRFDEYLEGDYTFIDGTPFGIKE